MNAIETHFSLRSRLSARAASRPTQPPAAADSLALDDPFAGDDEPWAPEDWIGDWTQRPDTAEDTSARQFVRLVLGLGLTGLAWFAATAAALQAYDLLT